MKKGQAMLEFQKDEAAEAAIVKKTKKGLGISIKSGVKKQ